MYVVRWDGISWSPLGSGFNAYVSALALVGNDLYAGGSFTTAGNMQANYIAKWNGSGWSPLGSGVSGPVYALAVAGNDLYVAGLFATAGTNTVNNIVKWAIGATNDSGWSPLGSVVGGAFTNSGTVGVNYIAKWDGTTWSAVGSVITYWVTALASCGSDLYAGGYFSGPGLTARNIARWDGQGWAALGSGLNSTATALVCSGTNLYVGGTFTTAGDKVSAYVARAVIPPASGRFRDSTVTNGAFACTFADGTPGSRYRIQTSHSPVGPWTDFTNFTYSIPVRILDAVATSNRCYRATSP